MDNWNPKWTEPDQDETIPERGWFEEYHCGCVSETVKTKRELLGDGTKADHPAAISALWTYVRETENWAPEEYRAATRLLREVYQGFVEEKCAR